MRLLIIEDSQVLRDGLTLGLREAGYAVDSATDGEEGLWAAAEVDYDLIILDAMLPKRHGFDIVRELRARQHGCAILILTALAAVHHRIDALDRGADDYMPKPFDFGELLARVRALLRRRYQQTSTDIHIGPLLIDTARRRVLRDGAEVSLRPREYAVLEYLARNRGRVVSTTEIAAHLYDDRQDLGSNTVESAISMLRRAIDRPHETSLIRTRRGAGYEWAYE